MDAFCHPLRPPQLQKETFRQCHSVICEVVCIPTVNEALEKEEKEISSRTNPTIQQTVWGIWTAVWDHPVSLTFQTPQTSSNHQDLSGGGKATWICKWVYHWRNSSLTASKAIDLWYGIFSRTRMLCSCIQTDSPGLRPKTWVVRLTKGLAM